MRLDLLLIYLANGVMVGILYGLVAMSFVLIYKASRVINFAQGELLLLGAWICWTIVTNYGIPFWAAFLLTGLFCSVLGILIQRVIMQPLIGEPLISLIMVTVGLSVFLQSIMKGVFGVSPRSFPPVFPVDKVSILGLNLEVPYIASAVLAVILLGLFGYFFQYSKFGLAMRATAFNQQVAQSMGVSIRQVFALSWAISAFVSAMAGVFVGLVNGVSSGLATVGVKVFPAVILGGLDSIIGAIVGGIIVGLLENFAEFLDGQYLHFGNLYTIVPFYVLVIILMFKPYGLFGTRDIERI
ncbi:MULTISPECIES: branched-chain amino acid ABC transporter permease [unclassified Afipia]|uniref:branched-chain amino acid ABC transporter permease n=1 Tax=unclassified Afipia TaxID=2642050 RepID=UPI000409B530|nr:MULTISPECIES: branched-chain amino acid ABC transporter permease [unclassified Afipia]